MDTQPGGVPKWVMWVVGVLVIVAVAGGGFYAFERVRSLSSRETEDGGAKPPGRVGVEVVHPKAGGIQRVSTQPGTVEPFEAADLYAKASGFLAEQSVDIGSKVKKGEVLARISVPEYEKQVARDEAKVRDADARVKQMEAHLTAAKADARAADTAVTLAKVMVRAKTAFHQYREKQLKRIKELVRAKALDARLEDEQEDYYLSALEAENARLRALVDHAHAQGFWIRFYTFDGFEPGTGLGWGEAYNFRSRAAVEKRWLAALQAGVNFIATDQYEDLAAFMRQNHFK